MEEESTLEDLIEGKADRKMLCRSFDKVQHVCFTVPFLLLIAYQYRGILLNSNPKWANFHKSVCYAGTMVVALS